jgi:tetratricopeptide (TPR) repeat protein
MRAFAILVFAACAWPQRAKADTAQERQSAERLLLQGHLDQANSELQRLLVENPKDGESYLLQCRAYYAEELQEQAIHACEEAVQDLPRSSDAQDWLGRAYGRKASHANPLAAFALALKVKAAFEAAVALNPANSSAVDDLSEYYVNAPLIVGGGADKATALADRSAATLPQSAHRMRALLAEKQKDALTAEREFEAAWSVAHQPGAMADLAAFYKRQHRYDEAVRSAEVCIKSDRAKDSSLVDAAVILTEMHREQVQAADALRQYLDGNGQSDAAPAPHVHVLLGGLLEKAGDRTAAKIEYEKALSLAQAYEPAKQALRTMF